jgi:hypothetical protein
MLEKDFLDILLTRHHNIVIVACCTGVPCKELRLQR